MATAYHLVHYRQFNPQPQQSRTLETLWRSALDRKHNKLTLWQRVGDRIFDLPDVESRKIVLNKVADLASAIFGEMCLVQSDGFQALLKLTAANIRTSNITTAEIFNLQDRSAPRNAQFIRGMAYWLAIGNHLFFVKTQSMTAENLRQYIEWLLKTRSALLHPSVEMNLQAEFDRSQLGGDIGEITSLRVSGSALPMSVQAAANAPETSTKFTQRIREYARRIEEKSVVFE
jgi:hypothetical protein